ncbi:hypothetical protein [Georhizobium profundi]|uniref:hypothetical protein n=1 Tax=Georhizobium profundi TaxID=2341112 RepID=UPI000F7E8931|nr:hypothetical protein [Georhizobium profundi]
MSKSNFEGDLSGRDYFVKRVGWRWQVWFRHVDGTGDDNGAKEWLACAVLYWRRINAERAAIAMHQAFNAGVWCESGRNNVDALQQRVAAVSGTLEAVEPVAWPIETEDQVEALARECDWDNRKYMTPPDYTIWCERMRKFARLAAAPPSDPVGQAAVTKYCTCKNSKTNPCIVCGKKKFIDPKWLLRRLEAHPDEGEIGAGREMFSASPAPEAGSATRRDPWVKP